MQGCSNLLSLADIMHTENALWYVSMLLWQKSVVVCHAASVNQGSVNEISQTDPSAASGLYRWVMSENAVDVTECYVKTANPLLLSITQCSCSAILTMNTWSDLAQNQIFSNSVILRFSCHVLLCDQELIWTNWFLSWWKLSCVNGVSDEFMNESVGGKSIDLILHLNACGREIWQ